MSHANADPYQDLRDAVRALCAEFPPEYHRKVDEKRGYPEEFVDALTKAGWMAALIPQEYGGSGLGLTEASVIMEEINRAGGNSGACHGQMYNMGTLLRHGSTAQKDFYLPKIAKGELRLQSMGVTEPTTGTDTTKIKTTAVRKGDRYVVNGQKVWISRIQHSDLMILLARTTPLAEVARRGEGLSLFLVDLRQGNQLLYLPFDKLIEQSMQDPAAPRTAPPAVLEAPALELLSAFLGEHLAIRQALQYTYPAARSYQQARMLPIPQR
jgi:acyl-CoA dehydrogenase